MAMAYSSGNSNFFVEVFELLRDTFEYLKEKEKPLPEDQKELLYDVQLQLIDYPKNNVYKYLFILGFRGLAQGGDPE